MFCCPGFYILHIGKKIIENDDYGKKIKKAGFWLVKEKGAVYTWIGSEVVFKKKRKNGRKWSEKEEHQNGKKKKRIFPHDRGRGREMIGE